MIQLHLFGAPYVHIDGVPLTGAPAQPRRFAILALLARAGERGITREKIVSLLWPDVPEEKGRRLLTQAVYALRQDLGTQAAIEGTGTLRLDPASVTVDVTEFESALKRGDLEAAVAQVSGSFLDGFSLPEADGFERWVETERRTLHEAHLKALRDLAKRATGAGRPSGAVERWRQFLAVDPADTQATMELMRALAQAGDIGGVTRAAEAHAEYLKNELDLPPAPQIEALAVELKQQAANTPPHPISLAAVARAGAELFPSAEPPRRRAADRLPLLPRWYWGIVVSVSTIVAVLGIRAYRAGDTQALIVIGRIAEFDTARDGSLGRSVGELLATNLARASGTAVVSTARLLELMGAETGVQDTSISDYLLAARKAGASEVFEGSLFSTGVTTYRVDLRRIDPTTGVIVGNRVVTGSDLYAMTDTLALWVASVLGGELVTGPPPTGSIDAYRWYIDGLRAFVKDELGDAEQHFTQALAYDSMLVMAEYYRALSASDLAVSVASLQRAHRLSYRLGLRDRLVVEAAWSQRYRPGAVGRLADSLAGLFPAEVEGHYYKGVAAILDGDATSAIFPLRRAMAMTEEGARGGRAESRLADISANLIRATIAADSITAAEALARQWIARQPRSARAFGMLAWVLAISGHPDEAIEAYTHGADLEVGRIDREEVLVPQILWVYRREGRYADFDRYADSVVGKGVRDNRSILLQYRAEALRQRGQLHAAYAMAHEGRLTNKGRFKYLPAMLEGRLLLDLGDLPKARALFDSIATESPTWHVGSPETVRRVVAMPMMLLAEPVAQMGDTAGLIGIVDSLRRMLPEGASARESAPYHHARGLLLELQGRRGEAEAEYVRALQTPVEGYTRTNLALARIWLRTGRAKEAVRVLRAALRSPDGTTSTNGLHAPRTSLLGHLIVAYERAGEPDSAQATRVLLERIWDRPEPGVTLRPDTTGLTLLR